MGYAESDPGSVTKTVVGIAPQAGTVAINGSAIDTEAQEQGYQGALLALNVGASTGSPTSFTADAKLQSNPVSSGGTWTDVPGSPVVTVTAINGISVSGCDIRGAARYLRAVVTPAFVGGTSPTLLVDAVVVLTGPRVRPSGP